MKNLILTFSTTLLASYALAANPPEKYVTISGAEFNLVKTAPVALGNSYQDPWGLIWGDINGHDHSHGPNQVNYSHAKDLCSQITINGIKGRIATLDEVLRVRETMRDPSYQPGPPYKDEYDSSRPPLPNFPSRSWATCKSYFDFAMPSDNVRSCLTASSLAGFDRYTPDADNYMFAYRCVVETAGYKAPLLKIRSEYYEMSKKTPPPGSVQPPFARLGHIEKVKLDLLLSWGAVGGADDILEDIGEHCSNYGKPTDESQLNLNSCTGNVADQLLGTYINKLTALDFSVLFESTEALADVNLGKTIQQELLNTQRVNDSIVLAAKKIGNQMKLLNNEVNKLPWNTPETDSQLRALWIQYKNLLAQAVALRPPARNLIKDYDNLVRFVGPAEKLGQPTYTF